ncbi:hypothetical protein ACF0H5_021666 [Mactra antiquata]
MLANMSLNSYRILNSYDEHHREHDLENDNYSMYMRQDREVNSSLSDETELPEEDKTEVVGHFQSDCGCKNKTGDTTYSFVQSLDELENILNLNTRKVIGYSCAKIFNLNIRKPIPTDYLLNTASARLKIQNSVYQNITTNCEQFKITRGYLDSPFTEIELNFPIAFSIIAYQKVEQIEYLLRAIYRPQNFYCIHMDAKSSTDDVLTIGKIASCFENVFLASRAIAVKWGAFTVLEAELICMDDLYKKGYWKYFINLTGQEFPLKTNLELVKILTAMEGANVVEGRYEMTIKEFSKRWKKAGPAPHEITPVKGSVHVAINRDFVKFALYDKKSIDFIRWLKKTEIPDETFFSSLNYNPHLKISGAFLGDPEEYPLKPTFTRYKNWAVGHGVWTRHCDGKYIRSICILGVGDLLRVKDDISLFVNKLHLEFQPLTYRCLEEMIFNRTRDQYKNQLPIDTTYYSMLDQVRYRIRK